MKPKRDMVEFARNDGFLNSIYRAYLHTKRFVFYHLGFNVQTWYAKGNRILSCDIPTKEVWDMFVPKKDGK